MISEQIADLRQRMLEETTFHYYPDRESPWLLSRILAGDRRVRALKATRAGRLLGRPLVKPLVASGDGLLRHMDVLALAHVHRQAFWDRVSPAALPTLDQAMNARWQDYQLTFGQWAVGDADWHYAQVSRPGGNMVLQLGFPSDHAALVERHMDSEQLDKFENRTHPIRQDGGRPTLAWSRLDIDVASGEALIEEVQSDWIREVTWTVCRLEHDKPQSRELRNHRAYQAELTERYGRSWTRAMMLATLVVLREAFGIRRVFMHQLGPGATLKGMDLEDAPRSLYSDLPRRFLFQPTQEAPVFLEAARRRDLSILRRDERPLFWLLDFDDMI